MRKAELVEKFVKYGVFTAATDNFWIDDNDHFLENDVYSPQYGHITQCFEKEVLFDSGKLVSLYRMQYMNINAYTYIKAMLKLESLINLNVEKIRKIENIKIIFKSFDNKLLNKKFYDALLKYNVSISFGYDFISSSFSSAENGVTNLFSINHNREVITKTICVPDGKKKEKFFYSDEFRAELNKIVDRYQKDADRYKNMLETKSFVGICTEIRELTISHNTRMQELKSLIGDLDLYDILF